MTKYICLLLGNSLGYSGYVQCIIAGFKHKDRNTPHMHLGTITGYQLENNTKPLSDSKLREQFEEMFKEFKKTWQEKQVLKKAKALLMQK